MVCALGDVTDSGLTLPRRPWDRTTSLLEDEKRSLQAQLSTVTTRLADGESSKGAVQQLKKTLEAELQDLRDQLAEALRARAALEKEKKVCEQRSVVTVVVRTCLMGWMVVKRAAGPAGAGGRYGGSPGRV
jgi:septal ring factor EnvC (AmiA/AmiB activator)